MNVKQLEQEALRLYILSFNNELTQSEYQLEYIAQL